MKKTRIITHPGKAHRDDYLACCCIAFDAYSKGMLSIVERRMPGSGDLEDPGVWVVDTGGRHEPAARNFDHHQDDPTLAEQCSLDLVLRFLLGPTAYASYRSVSPWLRLTALHDTKGSNAAADDSGISVKAYSSTRSPVEKTMLTLFSDLTVVHPETPLMNIMRETGRMLLTEARSISTAIPNALLSAPPPFPHSGLRVWDIRGVSLEADAVSTAMVNHLSSAKAVDVVISQNGSAGTGVRIYRQIWATNKLDLCLIADHPGVRFVHKNGFYAILAGELSDAEIMGLLTRAAA